MSKNPILLLGCLFVLFSYSSSAENLYSDTSRGKIKSSKKTIIIRDAPEKDFSEDCEKISPIRIIIDEAISVGAPTYNEGNHLGCYRIYEGAAYKILHKYGSKCKEVRNTLESALEKSYGDYNATEKAWIMRMAFDQILGVPTTTK
jgi:hypothetical protein